MIASSSKKIEWRGLWRDVIALEPAPAAELYNGPIQSDGPEALRTALAAGVPASRHAADVVHAVIDAGPWRRPFAEVQPLVVEWVQAMVVEQDRSADKRPLVDLARACINSGNGASVLTLKAVSETGALDWRSCFRGECGDDLYHALQYAGEHEYALLAFLFILPEQGVGHPKFEIKKMRWQDEVASEVPLHRALPPPVASNWSDYVEVVAWIAEAFPRVAVAWSKDVDEWLDVKRDRFPTARVSALIAGGVRLSARALEWLSKEEFVVETNGAWKKYASFAGACLHHVKSDDVPRLWEGLRDAGIPLDNGTAGARWNTPLYAAAEVGACENVLTLLRFGANAKLQRRGASLEEGAVHDLLRARAGEDPNLERALTALLAARNNRDIDRALEALKVAQAADAKAPGASP